MTAAEALLPNPPLGRLKKVLAERNDGSDTPNVTFVQTDGVINANLTIGSNIDAAKPLIANRHIAWDGVKLHGKGFIVPPTTAKSLGLGETPGLEAHIRPYRNGRDIQQQCRGMLVIDLFGLTEAQVRRQHPGVFQHVMLNVKPERNVNRRASYRNNWWIFGEPRREMRPALYSLSR